MIYILIALVAYCLGSFSTGLLISKNSQVDLRNQGSKNTGASNVLRLMGVKAAAFTFLGDVLKAVVACAFGLWLGGRDGGILAGLCVILGHNWPVFFGFKGGKGVASSCAVMLVLFPIPALISFVVAIVLIWITRMISVGSMAMLALFAIIVCATNWGNWLVCLWAIVLAVLCFVRHRANIKRILNGCENKLGQKKSK
ncbi:MAG: glycerol-3-phosphate 1-O-acyltransferase PlsY [Clostridia bacterium]|nr:glycerol-3-phosphate 1-O-acyltransferase PlsY [Clostridia bacterium]